MILNMGFGDDDLTHSRWLFLHSYSGAEQTGRHQNPTRPCQCSISKACSCPFSLACPLPMISIMLILLLLALLITTSTYAHDRTRGWQVTAVLTGRGFVEEKTLSCFGCCCPLPGKHSTHQLFCSLSR